MAARARRVSSARRGGEIQGGGGERTEERWSRGVWRERERESESDGTVVWALCLSRISPILRFLGLGIGSFEDVRPMLWHDP